MVSPDPKLVFEDALPGNVQLGARCSVASRFNSGGVARTKAIGRGRIARKRSDALPGGENPLRAPVRLG
jgi:hypothetical protein